MVKKRDGVGEIALFYYVLPSRIKVIDIWLQLNFLLKDLVVIISLKFTFNGVLKLFCTIYLF